MFCFFYPIVHTAFPGPRQGYTLDKLIVGIYSDNQAVTLWLSCLKAPTDPSSASVKRQWPGQTERQAGQSELQWEFRY